jgi:hypothetical protein
VQVQQIPRKDFLEQFWDYRPGEHVNIISPTGAGKSFLTAQLLGQTLAKYPDLDVAWQCPKPNDPAMDAWGQALQLREVDSWPPRYWPWQSHAAGHILWPKHIVDDETRNRAHIAETFRAQMNHAYWHGHSITVADDCYLTGVIYGLNTELDRHWIAGRSNKAGLWTTLQKPSGTVQGAVSSFAYDAPTHMFFGRDSDERNLKRISEISISALDPEEIKSLVRHLPVHRIGDDTVSDMLYVDRRGPYLAQIQA